MLKNNPQDFIDQLRVDLLNARKAQDQLTTTTLQGVLSAIDNAGAVPVPNGITTLGTGSTEVARQELSIQDMRKIVEHEIVEVQDAIETLDEPENPYVVELNKRIVILEAYL